MNNNMLVKKIEEIVKPIVSELSYELYHIEYVKEDGNFYLRIYIDKEDDRISLNDCEAVSRRVSDVFDIDDPFDTPYYLEVSSPGIYRNLYKDEHYRQVVGKEISVKLTSSLNGTKSIKGILKNIDDNEIVILNEQNEISIPKEKIKSANLEGEI